MVLVCSYEFLEIGSRALKTAAPWVAGTVDPPMSHRYFQCNNSLPWDLPFNWLPRFSYRLGYIFGATIQKRAVVHAISNKVGAKHIF